MSETIQDAQSEHLNALKATYKHLAFIHQKFLTTQFYLEEMAQADSAMKFVQEMANKVVNEIQTLEATTSEASNV